MDSISRIEDNRMPQRNGEAKDEMNLAEFPLCALSHRLRPDVKTLRFEDRIWDESQKKTITRQLIVTGSDAYGLPTELDDEVLLGLIQITRLRGFAERKVPFTRHELIRMLGWRDESKSYQRIEASLNRWTGVTLYYNKAWWNKERKCWMDEKFHVLDNVWLCHRNEPPPDTGLSTTGAPQSAFVWNEVIFRSFTHGNLKSIDFEFFKSLKSAVAKRLYRFLDKRFYHRRQFEMDLKELCWEHIGLSRNYDTANLKRKLLSGIRELERRQFLHPLPPGDQFTKIRSGEWRVALMSAAKQSQPASALRTEVVPPVVQSLVQRGITLAAAERTVKQFPAERIQAQVEIFDWLVSRKDVKVSRNPAGFLVSSIQHGYSLPKGFSSPEKSAQRQTEVTTKPRTNRKPEDEQQQREQAISQFWNSLSGTERARAEAEALAEASVIQRDLLERGGSFAAAAQKLILNAYASNRIRDARGNCPVR